MHKRRSRTLLAISLTAAVALSACGDDEKESSDTSGGEASGALAGICPDTVVLQTDWMPEAEHGFIYNLIGDGFTMDAGKAYVTGPLVAGGVDTGVDLQVRSGGLPQQFSPVTEIMYNNDDVLLGFVYTDEGIQFSGSEFPTIAMMSGFEKNPQMIMWDPETYPDVKGIADLGTEGVTVRYFGGAAYMDFLTGTGVLSKDQVDGSYTGDPALFIADEGAAAQQGFGSAEPYLYETEITDWGKKVSYEYINDIGWENYAQSIATKPGNVEEYKDCFAKLIPMIQQSSVDFLNDPSHAKEVIMAAVTEFGGDFGWTYGPGAFDYGVATIKADGLQANGTDGTFGSFDMDRIAGLIEIAVPVYEAQGSTPKEGVTPEDVVTSQFIDPSIKL